MDNRASHRELKACAPNITAAFLFAHHQRKFMRKNNAQLELNEWGTSGIYAH